MKNGRGSLLHLLLAFGTVCVAGAPLTKLERQRLIAHLEMTESWLLDEVRGLSAAQLQFRPASEAWCVLEVIDHVVVSELVYWQDFEKAMKAPPSGQVRPGADADVLWYGIDRSQRQKALPAEKPKGQLHDLRAGLDAFSKLRAQMLRYARTTNDDLRNHVVERERCDAYQWLVLISSHAQRHILQIREIKANPKFPKE